jgi:hypothetical protein
LERKEILHVACYKLFLKKSRPSNANIFLISTVKATKNFRYYRILVHPNYLTV